MRLLINTPAVDRSSLGVRRYAQRVAAEFNWPGGIDRIEPLGVPALERAYEMVRRGAPGSILWTPCQRGPLFAHHHVVTVHDCISIEYTYRHDWRLPAYVRLFDLLLRGAEVVVAISHATKAAVLRNSSIDAGRVVVVPTACTGLPVAPSPAARSAAEPPYALMVTNALPHKNNLAACQAFARSRAARVLALRVVGTLPADARLACQQGGVRLLEHRGVDDQQLADWYAGCAFFLSPSLAEGHNLPITEAVTAGANVLCSDIDAHREFYSGQVRFFDPCRVEAITDAIDQALDEPEPWFPAHAPSGGRTFADVARDYEAIFAAITPSAVAPARGQRSQA